MPELELYEKKILHDEECPVQISVDRRSCPCTIFHSHWHEHLEIHYVVSGEADFMADFHKYPVVPGDLLIINSNELHYGICRKAPYVCNVIIFNIADLSPELAKQNIIFKRKISGDPKIAELEKQIFMEYEEKQFGYKQQCRSLVMELLVYLCRTNMWKSLPEPESRKRKKDLERLNIVLAYIEKHMSEPITNAELADLICLSEDRFGHLFREKVGKPPIQYLNDIRLKKAVNLLMSNAGNITEISEAVGFQDYNSFGRLFRKRFGCTPYEVKNGSVIPDIK